MTLRADILRQYAALKTERESFVSHWRDLNDFISPRSARFLLTDRNKGDKRNYRILDNTATLAMRTLASGMMAGITSPARPWFRLAPVQPGFHQSAAVKDWLHVVEERMREVFLRSNIYNVLPITYSDLGLYGTHCMFVAEDEDDVIRCYPMPAGSYCISNSERLQVDTVIREFQMTARQLVQRYGKDKVSQRTRSLYEAGNKEAWITVLHYIGPNAEHDDKKLLAKHKRFLSVYLEQGGDDADEPLSVSGFDSFPCLAPRWSLTGEDVYGGSPGMDCLPDVKGLQLLAKRKTRIIDKGSDPPMTAPSSLRNSKASLLPGDVTYIDVPQGGNGFTPAYTPNHGWVQVIAADMAETQQRIRRGFFEDLFLMLAQSDRRQITAREIEERHEEKLLMLGPVLERLNDELLDPLIDRTFEIMLRMGVVPDPPDELQGVELKVEYISVMAQAMRMAGIGGVERLVGFVGNLAGARPDALDKLNVDTSIDAVAEMLGVPPGIVLTDEEVQAIRRQRAQQAAQQQAMQTMAAGAQGAKLLSEVDLEADSALSRMMGVA